MTDNVSKEEMLASILDIASDIINEGQFAHLIKRDKDIEKKVGAHWKKTTGQKTVQPRDFGRAKAAWKEHETNKSLGLEERALEISDVVHDVPATSDELQNARVIGAYHIKGKTVKLLQMGNFLAPVVVVLEEEPWKDAGGSIFRFNGQSAALQAIHAMLSGGGSHVPAVPEPAEPGGEEQPLKKD